MAATFAFQPGVRINEVELARRLSVSRTPLREAFSGSSPKASCRTPNKGFFCRELDPRQIYDLYELRRGLEMFSVRLACERATNEDLRELERFLARRRTSPTM